MLTIDTNLLKHTPDKYAIPTEAERAALAAMKSQEAGAKHPIASMIADLAGWLFRRRAAG